MKFVILTISLSCLISSAIAKEPFTPCIPVPGQSRRVEIPPELGKFLLKEDHVATDTELACCGRWWEKDPNELYLATSSDLNGDGVEEYLIRTKPDGPREFGHNNPVWIVETSHNSFNILYHGQAGLKGGPIAIPSITYSYHDICITQTDSATDTTVVILGFDGRQYRPKQCRTLVYGYDSKVEKVEIKNCSTE